MSHPFRFDIHRFQDGRAQRAPLDGEPASNDHPAPDLASAPLAAPDSAVALACPDADFDALVTRYVDLLVGPPDADLSPDPVREAIAALDTQATRFRDALTDRPGRVFTNLGLVKLTRSINIQTTALQLATMAKAWATPTSRFHDDDDLAEAVLDGLQRFCDLQYHKGRDAFDNWYHWEIAAARGVLDTTAILHRRIPATLRSQVVEAVEWFIPDPREFRLCHPDGRKPSSGSNRLELSLYVAVAGALGRRADRITLAAETAPSAYAFTTEGDGFHPDGSFLAQQNVPYTGAYGRAMVTAASLVLPLFRGSRWQLSHRDTSALVVGVERCFRPWIFNAQTLPGVLGRAVSRGDVDSYWLISSILALAEAVDVPTRDHWYGLARGWLERDHKQQYFRHRDVMDAVRGVRALTTGPTAVPERDGSCLFPQMDRLTHRGPGWCISIGSASTRTRRWDSMNGENVKAWHQNAGTRYLHLADDPRQYVNDWFPTVDPYRMPGTTIDSTPLEDTTGGLPALPGDEERIGPVGIDAFTGGSSVGGQYEPDGFYSGATCATWAHHTESWRSGTRARLAWFTLSEGMVCLGSGISGDTAGTVETVLENRMTWPDTDRSWSVDGAAVPDSARPGWSAVVEDVTTLSLGNQVSFVMLDRPRTVHLRHDVRSGAWRDINAHRGRRKVEATFQTAWLDHGGHPVNESFSYLLLPTADPQKAHLWARQPSVVVLANDAERQAVGAGDFTGLVAHEAGELVDHHRWRYRWPTPCTVSVLRRAANSAVELAISDPTQAESGLELQVELPTRGASLIGADDHLDCVLEGATLTVRADTRDALGVAHRVWLTLA